MLVQEGMTDPENFMYQVVKRVRVLPRWFASTAATGLSGYYDRFCVASEGYRDLFVGKGCDPSKIGSKNQLSSPAWCSRSARWR